jgi:hypothetical protein
MSQTKLTSEQQPRNLRITRPHQPARCHQQHGNSQYIPFHCICNRCGARLYTSRDFQQNGHSCKLFGFPNHTKTNIRLLTCDPSPSSIQWPKHYTIGSKATRTTSLNTNGNQQPMGQSPLRARNKHCS